MLGIRIYRDRLLKLLGLMSKYIYELICTRLDVLYALSIINMYQSDASEGHWTTVNNILEYLRKTKDIFLTGDGKEEIIVNIYIDATSKLIKVILDRSLNLCFAYMVAL